MSRNTSITLALIVRNRAGSGARSGIAAPISCRRGYRVNPSRPCAQTISPELNREAVRSVRLDDNVWMLDDNVWIGRIGRLIAGARHAEGTRSHPRQCVCCRDRGHLDHLVVGRPKGTGGGHTRNHRGCHIDVNPHDLRGGGVARLVGRGAARRLIGSLVEGLRRGAGGDPRECVITGEAHRDRALAPVIGIRGGAGAACDSRRGGVAFDRYLASRLIVTD